MITELSIELSGVAVHYGRTFELKDLDLKVPAGAVYGFLGPNGSGKTTTIKTLVGLLRADRGTVRVLGYDIAREAPRALLRTGYVPERPHLYKELTVAESLRYHGAWYPTWDARWADQLRGAFGLDLDARVGRLSKGETGKLMILLAIAQRPELLVLDEPTDGLDPVVRRDVLSAVLDYVSETNATVFISSHLIHELERICDWVGVLESGALVAELPMHTFKEGIKRLRVSGAPAQLPTAPFVLLARGTGLGSAEEWVVRGWQPPMQVWFEGIGANLRDVVDLDLEESFVELLRTARAARRRGVA
ncbi:MAG: ABC transporter ATP-binding protein [Gemmatimonadetes bacterium]|nr:ABC transporter ATP-binding protein [Gemmatimonadota bacterium]